MRKFITGDLHNDETGELRALQSKQWITQKELEKSDILIQLGDFGFYYSYPEFENGYKDDLKKRIQLSKKNFSLFVIPGNHENYDVIEKLPTIKKWGGEIFKEELPDGNIYIAKRGEIYEIDGKTYFTFGGALSSDADDRHKFHEIGTYKRMKKMRYGQFIRMEEKKIKISQIGHWERELPSEEEYEYALRNLALHNFKVDYILTHTCPEKFIGDFIKKDEYNDAKFDCPVGKFLNKIYDKVEFKEWYFGHLHVNSTISTNRGLLTCHYYSKPIEIDI